VASLSPLPSTPHSISTSPIATGGKERHKQSQYRELDDTSRLGARLVSPSSKSSGSGEIPPPPRKQRRFKAHGSGLVTWEHQQKARAWVGKEKRVIQEKAC